MSYEQITTLEAAIAAVLPDPKRDERDLKRKEAEDKLRIAVDAINGPDWLADWNDTEQEKYIIWWRIIKKTSRVSGRGLSLRVVGYADTYSGAGPRLVFRSKQHALHCAEYFLDLWESYYLG